ncbi:MAG: sigma-70 family RNA polymerase sigma factor [Candidatus Marinimicrobia bacterium]|nr:sigma-70 family RNA polymerase sigma factor [Candidatus Neomarinimicrobiota bacterium]
MRTGYNGAGMDSKQIERLYREEKAKMLSYVRSHMNDRTRDAEDIVQDVMLKMFRLINLNTKIENLAAYAWRSLKNLVIDSYRRRDSQDNEDIDDHHDRLASEESTPEENMLREHFSDYLKDALKQLKPSERAIWIATEVDGVSFHELAMAWNEPVGTLLSRKCRAEKKILSTMNNIYEGDKK